MYFLRLNRFHYLLEGRHPTGRQMAVLEESPTSPLHSVHNHAFRFHPLPLSQRYHIVLPSKLHLLCEFGKIAGGIGSRGEDEDEGGSNRGILEGTGDIKAGRIDEFPSQVLCDEFLNGGNHLIGTKASQDQHPLEGV